MDMNDEQNRDLIKIDAPTSSEQINSSEVTPGDNDIAGAFRDLGQQFLELFRAVGENERVQQFRQDVVTGLQTVTEQMQKGVQNLTQSEPLKNVQEQAEKVSEHPVAHNIGSGISELVGNLSTGISRLAEQIRTAGTNTGEGSATASSPSDKSDIIEPITISTNDAEAVEQIADMNGAINPGSRANAVGSNDDLKTSRMDDGPIS